MKQYCIEFELSNCNKKICCHYCDETKCTERCGVHHYNNGECGSLLDKEPKSFYEMFEEVEIWRD